MDSLSQLEFEQLVDGAKALAYSLRGPRVYLTTDHKVVKIFRQKGWMSSNRLLPYALRFERNANRLKAMGFSSVTVEKVAKCRHLDSHLVVYPLLPGETIRELADRPAKQQYALARLPGYLCKLHNNGVYYKALHLGNILMQTDGSFALIDIHWTKFYKRPISVNNRLGNIFNILGYAEDHASLARYGLNRFFVDYLSCCQLDEKHKAILLGKLRNSRSFPELKQLLYTTS
ncbi:MAG: hypothetical protein MAG794_01141 [Gammaproteobacteria bacterium]|nr:hypothetical protein [Gammaproteobacteria bacterium]